MGSQTVQAANKNKRENTKFKYVGVRRIQSGNWQAKVQYRGKNTNVGVFASEIEAVIARNTYIKENNLPNKLNWLQESYAPVG